jgi:hypothetical protein
LFNVRASISPHKVVWKEIGGKISGKGQFSVAVLEQIDDEHLGRRIAIPDHKIMFISFEDIDEAHYVASILNSSIVRLIVASYTIETGMNTHITKCFRNFLDNATH